MMKPNLGDEIAEMAAHLDAATHRLLTHLRTFDASGDWHKQGARSCAAWLSWRVGWDMRTANEHVRVATRLGKLPKIDDALRRGEMSFAKVRAMVRVATPANEEMLLEEARYSTGAQLEKICRQYASVRRHDHEATPKDDAQRRFLARHDTADGMVKIEGVFHPEEAAQIWAAIERVASERCREREDARRQAERCEAAAQSAETTDLGSAEPTKINNSPHLNSQPGTDPLEETRARSLRDSEQDAPGRAVADSEQETKARVARAKASLRKYPTGFDRADALLEIAEQVLRGTSPDRAPIDLVLTASVAALTAPFQDGDRARSDNRDDNHNGADDSRCRHHSNAASTPDAGSTPVCGRVTSDCTDCAAPDCSSTNTDTRQNLPALATKPHPAPPPEPTLGNYVQSRLVDPEPVGWIHPSELFDHITIDPDLVGVLGDGTCISPTAARRLACDCGLTSVLEDQQGSPITIGRKRRTIPASMKRALLRRDRTCRFPGCRAAVFIQGHHMRHWMDGGPTELDNLVSLCNFHHRFVHEYGYRVELSCEGEVRFTDPHGNVVTGVPDRPITQDLGWPSILTGNADLAITPETCACGWNGGPVDYHLCVDALIAADEGRVRYPL